MIKKLENRIKRLEAEVKSLQPKSGKDMLIRKMPGGTTYESKVIQKIKAGKIQELLVARWG